MAINRSAWWHMIMASHEMDLDDMLARYEGTITSMSRKLARGFEDDAAQAGRIAVMMLFRSGRVDETRSACEVASYIRTTIANAMHSETQTQNHLREHDSPPVCPDSYPADTPPREAGHEFTGILKLYYDHIVANGSLKNAHAAVAQKRGVCAGKSTQTFRRAAAKFLRDNDLDDRDLGFSRIVEAVMRYSPAADPRRLRRG